MDQRGSNPGPMYDWRGSKVFYQSAHPLLYMDDCQRKNGFKPYESALKGHFSCVTMVAAHSTVIPTHHRLQNSNQFSSLLSGAYFITVIFSHIGYMTNLLEKF